MIETQGEGSCSVVQLSSSYFALSFSPDKSDYTPATDNTRPYHSSLQSGLVPRRRYQEMLNTLTLNCLHQSSGGEGSKYWPSLANSVKFSNGRN